MVSFHTILPSDFVRFLFFLSQPDKRKTAANGYGFLLERKMKKIYEEV